MVSAQSVVRFSLVTPNLLRPWQEALLAGIMLLKAEVPDLR